MVVKDKKSNSQIGIIAVIIVFAASTVLGFLGIFIGLFPASVIGLIIAICATIYFRKKIASKTATDNERSAYIASFILSVLLLLDVLILGWQYSQGLYHPPLLNVGFPNAKQASSIFNTSLVTTRPYAFGDVGTGQSRVLADSAQGYQLSSNPSSTYFTISILHLSNFTEAAILYNELANPPNGSIAGNYNGLNYTVFSTYAVAYLNDYVIQITTYRSINKTNTVNFLKAEADIINRNS